MTLLVPQEDLLKIQMVDQDHSIFAQSGVANNGGQLHNEYIVFKGDQVYPEFLVTFTVS
jgi:hypothetical protein